MPRLVIAGTDTNVGKTVLSALLMSANDSFYYWKPVQSGLEGETDSAVIQRLSSCEPSRILQESYKLNHPLSPHVSARLDGVVINTNNFHLPEKDDLIIELAGGILVPMNDETLQIDIVAKWGLPVVVATRSSLGTINHTLLTLEALRKRNIRVAGCVPIGEFNPENEKAIETYGKTSVLGRIPPLGRLEKTALSQVYNDEFTAFQEYISTEKTKQ
jgi:dethiobiotin synthetase